MLYMKRGGYLNTAGGCKKLLHAALLGVALLPALAQAQEEVSGRAKGAIVAVGINGVLGAEKTLGDTGPLPANGGQKQAGANPINLKNGAVDLAAGIKQLSTSGSALEAASTVELSNVSLKVANLLGKPVLSLEVSKVKADTALKCNGPNPKTISANSQVLGLILNGKSVTVSSAANQTIDLGVAKVIINEVTKTGDNAKVNAIHVQVAGLADVVLAQAESGLKCPSVEVLPPDGGSGAGTSNPGTGTGTTSQQTGNKSKNRPTLQKNPNPVGNRPHESLGSSRPNASGQNGAGGVRPGMSKTDSANKRPMATTTRPGGRYEGATSRPQTTGGSNKGTLPMRRPGDSKPQASGSQPKPRPHITVPDSDSEGEDDDEFDADEYRKANTPK